MGNTISLPLDGSPNVTTTINKNVYINKGYGKVNPIKYPKLEYQNSLTYEAIGDTMKRMGYNDFSKQDIFEKIKYILENTPYGFQMSDEDKNKVVNAILNLIDQSENSDDPIYILYQNENLNIHKNILNFSWEYLAFMYRVPDDIKCLTSEEYKTKMIEIDELKKEETQRKKENSWFYKLKKIF